MTWTRRVSWVAVLLGGVACASNAGQDEAASEGDEASSGADDGADDDSAADDDSRDGDDSAADDDADDDSAADDDTDDGDANDGDAPDDETETDDDSASGSEAQDDPDGTATEDGDSPNADDATGSDDGPESSGESCGERSVPSTPLRRLSADEYHNTLADLFGDESWRVLGDSLFPPTLVRQGFSTDAEANIVNTAESNAIEDNAARIAQLIDEQPAPFLRALLPCDVGASADEGAIDEAAVDACIDAFIAEFGLRAARRPLSNAEVTIARELYASVRAEGSASHAFAALVQYFVQSPALLYRTERGLADASATLVPLSPHEQASRLSYLLTGSMPDAELLDAAANDALSSPEFLRAQAERLLETERFYEVLQRFHRDWLELHGFEWKPPEEFPDFDAARGSLEREQFEFVRSVLDDGDGRIQSLLGSDRYPVNPTLAAYYGVDAGSATSEQWALAEVPNRRGLLTQASLMATLAGSNTTNPIHRGAFVQTQVLCRTLPSLPGNIDIQTPLQDSSGLPTARQRLAPLLENGQCSGCHSVINPVGLAFENYDAAGRWRTEENDTPLETAGTLNLDGGELTFDGPVELVEGIAASREARDCYAKNWYRMALGRLEFAEDACSLESLFGATAEADGDVRQMILALVQTDAFRHIRRIEP